MTAVSPPSPRPMAQDTHALSQGIPTFSPGERRVLSETELAQRWGLSPKTLQRWRSEGRGPRYLKLSKRVSYPVEAIVEFERHVLHESTSERATAHAAV
ncbi:helix-turn-helix transcriptional regulator [Ottowia testudinis]|nr:helix-turn-helix domain-containing protein [Ottowia testudinis]